MTEGYLLTKPAAKFLNDIPSSKLRRQILDKIARLSRDPIPQGAKKVRCIKNREGYRVRQGPYRIIYEPDTETNRVIVHAIGHRKDIYR
uniref:mRNA interferase RelE/StbE n=1 Tax=Candidatus Kentrum sp. DK TaxID=2126562 RepID=A0A450RYE4_9GAMM|nr:MAG: mRNA interferase RelE/StbE [Candidatus Kentron sp. DK]